MFLGLFPKAWDEKKEALYARKVPLYEREEALHLAKVPLFE